MSAKISDLQERQIVNIADGKCLGNIKDVELNVLEGCIQALVLPSNGGFLGLLQNQGEIVDSLAKGCLHWRGCRVNQYAGTYREYGAQR